MKKYLSGLLTGIIITLTISTFATTAIKEAYFNNEIKIVDSSKGQLNTEIVTVVKDGDTSGRNYVSVADLSSALGKTVTWDGSTKTINLSDSGISPTPIPAPTNIPAPVKHIDYQGYEAVEKDGIVYVVPPVATHIFEVAVSYEDPNITLSKNGKSITFSKYDTNYCIIDRNRNYIKLPVIQEIAGGK